MIYLSPAVQEIYALYPVTMANYNWDITAANSTELCSKDKGLTEETYASFYSVLDTITGSLKEISREGLPR